MRAAKEAVAFEKAVAEANATIAAAGGDPASADPALEHAAARVAIASGMPIADAREQVREFALNSTSGLSVTQVADALIALGAAVAPSTYIGQDAEDPRRIPSYVAGHLRKVKAFRRAAEKRAKKSRAANRR